MNPYGPEPCPRCSTAPTETADLSHAAAGWIPACGCYPSPPRCVVCHGFIVDGRCSALDPVCAVYGVLQPLPDVDPLWALVEPVSVR